MRFLRNKDHLIKQLRLPARSIMLFLVGGQFIVIVISLATLFDVMPVEIGRAVVVTATIFLASVIVLTTLDISGPIRRNRIPQPTVAELEAMPVEKRIDLLNQQRQSRLQLWTAIGVAMTVAFTGGGLVYTSQTLETTREQQITDRFGKAVEQLGSDKLAVRIGGIYALERIARDSVRDHPTVMEVLTTFVREPSFEEPSTPLLRADVQAALTVLGRRNPQRDRDPLDLSNAKLSSANLRHANLRGVNLSGTDLTGADLRSADLREADVGALLCGADLRDADLRGANFESAFLFQADFSGASLEGAGMSRADQETLCQTGK
jgi:hypothetical protein